MDNGVELFFLIAFIFCVGFLASIHTGYMDDLVRKADKKAEENKIE